MPKTTYLPPLDTKCELLTSPKEIFERETQKRGNPVQTRAVLVQRNRLLLVPLNNIKPIPWTERTIPDKNSIKSVFAEKKNPIKNHIQTAKNSESIQEVKFVRKGRIYNSGELTQSKKEEQLLDRVRSQIIGRNVLIEGPYGNKLKLYTDYTASGQDVKFIADELNKISELYANTHTDTSYCGSYMNHLLRQAEAMILKECRASHEEYFIIGGGSGSTFAIEMTQKILGTYIPPKTKQFLRGLGTNEEQINFETIKTNLRNKGQLPLVIVSPYEHHSNEITWRKQLCDIVEVSLSANGFMDLDDLELILKKHKNTRPIFGSFSAGSNVTGIKTDVEAVATICKKYGAKCFFDYAGIGPYVPIDLSKKTEDGELLIDGIYVSPHKFIGGPGSAGILIMNRVCYEKQLHPTHGGGGTVNAVGLNYEDYVDDIEEREKSGTPCILQIIRAGLAFQLKGRLLETILKKEERFNKVFFERMSKIPNLMIYGPKDGHSRINIISFNIMMDGPEGQRPIHFNFVVRLMNDIFGIQARGGCFCAGPYGHHLFGINKKISNRISFFLNHHQEYTTKEDQLVNFKPGWTRISLHYSLQDYELEYIMFAIEFLCQHAHKFLPLYTYDPCKGLWEHISYKWSIPKLEIGAILGEKREYVMSEEERISTLEKQKRDAISLLDKLPKSKQYDTVPELGTISFYYFEKGNLQNRDIVEEKCQIYKEHYLDWVRPTGTV